ncbi:hypothetical protein C8Q76DRAFT_245741 [Earliella scabrosa]|nr:hypothetical protein C8Q76DRAFT_245741 [Earliella scabrosa]
MRPVNPLAPTTDQAGEHDRSLMGPLYLGSLKYCPTIAQGKLLVKIALVGSTAEASRSRSVCREQGLWTSGWTENVRIKAPCRNPGGSVALPFSSCPSHSFLSALLHFCCADEAYPKRVHPRRLPPRRSRCRGPHSPHCAPAHHDYRALAYHDHRASTHHDHRAPAYYHHCALAHHHNCAIAYHHHCALAYHHHRALTHHNHCAFAHHGSSYDRPVDCMAPCRHGRGPVHAHD